MLSPTRILVRALPRLSPSLARWTVHPKANPRMIRSLALGIGLFLNAFVVQAIEDESIRVLRNAMNKEISQLRS